MPKKGDFKANAKPASVAKRAFNSSEKQKTRRAERNASRAKMVQAGKAHKGDGKDVDHKNHNTKDQKMSNLQTINASKNRAMNQYDKRKRK